MFKNFALYISLPAFGEILAGYNKRELKGKF